MTLDHPSASNNPLEMAPPLFSIVTVTLNCREDAIQTSKSIYAQDFRSYEHIIKDGGSTDRTVDAIRAIDWSIRIIVQPDSGIYDAMNQALAECKGRYVLFMNGGDEFRTASALTDVAKSIIKNCDPDVLYTYNYNAIQKTAVMYPRVLSRFYLFRRSINHQATYVRRDCFVRYGVFDLGFKVLADNDLLARLVLRHSARSVLCPIVSVNYRDGGFSSSPKNVVRFEEERKRIRKMYFSFPEQMCFGFLMWVTLRPLRRALILARPNTPFARFYFRVSNALNQWLGRQ
jgi:putative colanic acid biosynthesis glycosyltransferase